MLGRDGHNLNRLERHLLKRGANEIRERHGYARFMSRYFARNCAIAAAEELWPTVSEPTVWDIEQAAAELCPGP